MGGAAVGPGPAGACRGLGPGPAGTPLRAAARSGCGPLARKEPLRQYPPRPWCPLSREPPGLLPLQQGRLSARACVLEDLSSAKSSSVSAHARQGFLSTSNSIKISPQPGPSLS